MLPQDEVEQEEVEQEVQQGPNSTEMTKLVGQEVSGEGAMEGMVDIAPMMKTDPGTEPHDKGPRVKSSSLQWINSRRVRPDSKPN